MKALFINSLAKKCSIHESGKMIFDCLKFSNLCEFDYIEVDINHRKIPTGYDFYFFNYHFNTMNWLDVKSIKKDFGFAMTVDLEISPNNPFPFVSKDDFDIFCVIDPTVDIDCDKVFTFPRPLEIVPELKNENESQIPIIGSFGLPTTNKGFEEIIYAVNKEFDKAIVRINMPSTSDFIFSAKKRAIDYADRCKKIAKKGIDVQISYDFMDKKDLIKWCNKNTINCFFYTRDLPGLAATTDQAISSGKPLLVTNNDTFRHILKYIKPYPQMSIKEAINSTGDIVKHIQEDWSQNSFANKFDEMIKNIQPQIQQTKLKDVKDYTLKLKTITNSISNIKENIDKFNSNQNFIAKSLEKVNKKYINLLFKQPFIIKNIDLKKKDLVQIFSEKSFIANKIKNDKKYSNLFKSIKNIEIDTKKVINQGEKYFNTIAEKCTSDTIIYLHLDDFKNEKDNINCALENFSKFLKILSLKDINIKVIVEDILDLTGNIDLYSQNWSILNSFYGLSNVEFMTFNLTNAFSLSRYGLNIEPLFRPQFNLDKPLKPIYDKKLNKITLGNIGSFEKSENQKQLVNLMQYLDENFELILLCPNNIKDKIYFEETKQKISQLNLQDKIKIIIDENINKYANSVDIMLAPYLINYNFDEANIFKMIETGKFIISNCYGFCENENMDLIHEYCDDLMVLKIHLLDFVKNKEKQDLICKKYENSISENSVENFFKYILK